MLPAAGAVRGGLGRERPAAPRRAAPIGHRRAALLLRMAALAALAAPAAASINPNPALRVMPLGPIEEPAAAGFSFLILLINVRLLPELMAMPHALVREHPYPVLANMFVWMVAYFWSTVFHMHETTLSETMDYGMAVFSWTYMLYAACVRFLPFVPRRVWRTLFTLWYAYFAFYMKCVKFDYGFAVLSVGVLAVIHLVLWVPYCIQRIAQGFRYPFYYVFLNIFFLCVLPFELYDFPPLLGIFDGHSLWHGGGTVLQYCWTRFLLADIRATASAAPAAMRGPQKTLESVV